MTRSEIEKSLIQSVKGANWLNKKEIAKYLGCHEQGNPVRLATKGLTRIGQKYSAYDLSERLFNMQVGGAK